MENTKTKEGVTDTKFVLIKEGAKLSGKSEDTIRRFTKKNQDNHQVVQKKPIEGGFEWLVSLRALEKTFGRPAPITIEGRNELEKDFMSSGIETMIVRESEKVNIREYTLDKLIAEARQHLINRIKEGKYHKWLDKNGLQDNKNYRMAWAIKVVKRKLQDLLEEYGDRPEEKYLSTITKEEEKEEESEKTKAGKTGDPYLDAFPKMSGSRRQVWGYIQEKFKAQTAPSDFRVDLHFNTIKEPTQNRVVAILSLGGCGPTRIRERLKNEFSITITKEMVEKTWQEEMEPKLKTRITDYDSLKDITLIDTTSP